MSANPQPQPPEENSKMDALVKVVLVFFISLLSFSVGTFVGKQVSDSDHRRASLEADHTGRDVASADTKTESANEEETEDLAAEFLHKADPANTAADSDPTDEDGYSSYKREVAHHEEPAAKLATPPAPSEVKKEEPAKADPSLEAADKISRGHSPTSGQLVAPPRTPSQALPAAASTNLGKFTVQVASYIAENEAKQYAGQLKEKGWNAFYIPASVKGRTVYRVSVGLFDESSNAQVFMKQFLKESGSKDAFVTKIVQ